MPKSLHASLTSGAEREGVSLNTYIVMLLSERHIVSQMLNKIEEIEDAFKVSSPQENSKHKRRHIKTQTAHRIEEKKRKYKK